MIHTYSLTGMTCSSCEAKVKEALLTVHHVTSVEVSKNDNTATITMDKHIAITEFQKALGNEKYTIATKIPEAVAENEKSWLSIYKPILLIFFFITLVTIGVQFGNHHFDAMLAMRHFMAGFFLVFSFFKLLNVKGFAESYMMYDILAKKIPLWAYAYPYVELGLGIAYLINFHPFITNITTLLVMSISIVGVLQSVLQKKKIKCACLGAVFNLPMSTVTIIEDALMIMMSILMLLNFL